MHTLTTLIPTLSKFGGIPPFQSLFAAKVYPASLVETFAVPIIAATMVDDPTFNADAVPTITAHSTSIIDPTIKSDVTIAVIPMEDAAESKKYQKQFKAFLMKF